MSDNTRDLVIANTADLKNLEKKVDVMSEQLTELVTAVQHARGAWTTIVVVSGIIGFLAGQFSNIRTWLGWH